MEVLKRSAEKYDKDEKFEMDFIEPKKPRLEIKVSEVEDCIHPIHQKEQLISIEDSSKESKLSGCLISSKSNYSNNDLKSVSEDSTHVYTTSYKDKYPDAKQLNDSEMNNIHSIPFKDSIVVITNKEDDIMINDNDTKLNCIHDENNSNNIINKKDTNSEDPNDNIISSGNNKTNKKDNKKNKKNLNKIINANKHKIKKRNCKKNSNEKKTEEEEDEVEAKPTYIIKPLRLASIWENEEEDPSIKQEDMKGNDNTGIIIIDRQEDMKGYFGKKEFRFIRFPEFPQFPSIKKNRARKKQAALRGWKTKNKTAKKEEEVKKKMVESLEKCGLEFWWEL